MYACFQQQFFFIAVFRFCTHVFQCTTHNSIVFTWRTRQEESLKLRRQRLKRRGHSFYSSTTSNEPSWAKNCLHNYEIKKIPISIRYELSPSVQLVLLIRLHLWPGARGHCSTDSWKHFNHSYLDKHTFCTRRLSPAEKIWANEHHCHNLLLAKLPLNVPLGHNDQPVDAGWFMLQPDEVGSRQGVAIHALCLRLSKNSPDSRKTCASGRKNPACLNTSMQQLRPEYSRTSQWHISNCVGLVHAQQRRHADSLCTKRTRL